MTSWSCLPIESRKEVVKRLDFRTRFRFRHVSKTNQELVDSVPLYIPLVALSVKNENKAIVKFYTGIEKWIEVEYVHDGKGKTSVEVTEVSNGNFIQHGAIRQVDSPSAPMLALSAFKHVAMNPNTLSGAVDLNSTHHIKFKTALETDAFFGDRKFRTKILYDSPDNCQALSMRICTKDLEECREIEAADEEKPCLVRTHTRRLRARIEEEDLDKWPAQPSLVLTYAFPTREHREEAVEKAAFGLLFGEPGVHVEAIGLYGYLMHKTTHGLHAFRKLTPCGLVLWHPPTDLVIENQSIGCSMRWACRKHADPFDHWYVFKMSGFNDYPEDHPDFENLGLERVYPIVNGKCPLESKLFNHVTEYETLFAKQKTEEQKQKAIDRQKEEQDRLDTAIAAEVEKIRAMQGNPGKPEKKWPFFILVGFASVGFALLAAIIVAVCVI